MAPLQRTCSRLIYSLSAGAFISCISAVFFCQSAVAEAPQTQLIYAASFADLVENRDQIKPYRYSEQISTRRMTLRVPRIGIVTLAFNQRWFPGGESFFDNGFTLQRDPSEPVHLRGKIKVRSHRSGKRATWQPVAATIFGNGNRRRRFSIVFNSAGMSRQPGYYVDISGSTVGGIVNDRLNSRRVTARAVESYHCGNDDQGQVTTAHSHAEDSIRTPPPIGAVATHVLQVATEADFEWFQTYGSDSNTQIQSILNAVDVIYESQLDISVELATQIVLTANGIRYSSSNSETLLNDFRTGSPLSGADLYHLYTGKNTFSISGGITNSSVIGLAYVGVVCAVPSFSYGYTENVTAGLNPITTAHEMGHNFDASHDLVNTTTIMGTTLNIGSPPTEFSQPSKDEIGAWVSANSSCLSSGSGGGSPTATPTAPPGTSTPTPVPTATPTTPGGGIDPDPQPENPMNVSLTATLSKAGKVRIVTSLSLASTACTIELRAAAKQSDAMNGTILGTFDGSQLSTAYDFTINRKSVKLDKKKKVQNVHLLAQLSCPDGNRDASATVAIKPYNIKSSQSPLSVGAWIKLLKKGVAKNSPVRQ